jgi:hypothetical protein
MNKYFDETYGQWTVHKNPYFVTKILLRVKGDWKRGRSASDF